MSEQSKMHGFLEILVLFIQTSSVSEKPSHECQLHWRIFITHYYDFFLCFNEDPGRHFVI